MNLRDESFSPEAVDEQIDHLLQAPQQPGQVNISSLQMVHLLQGVYKEDPRLQKVWERLANHLSMAHSIGEPQENQSLTGKRFSQTSSSTIVKFPQVKGVGMQTQSRLSLRSHKWASFQRSLELLVAVLIMALLIGSLVTVLHLSHQKLFGQIGASQQGSKHGQIVYSTPEENGWVSGLAWSFDSRRVATAIGNSVGGQIEIWDVPTGQHKVRVPLNLYPIARPAWSPNSNLLAVPTSDAVVIVNGSTGKIGASYPAPSKVGLSTTATSASQPGTDNLASATILSGSNSSLPGTPTYGSAILKIWNVKTGQLLKSFASIDGISWSPDGHELVYANYVGAPSTKASVTILNVNTGQTVYVYQVSGNAGQAIGLDALWSPDGRYILSAENIVSSPYGKQSFRVKVWVA
jgi:hypothetical protein